MSLCSAADSVTASSELKFDFDDLIVNSAVYRRAMVAAENQSTVRQIHDIEGDIIELSIKVLCSAATSDWRVAL